MGPPGGAGPRSAAVGTTTANGTSVWCSAAARAGWPDYFFGSNLGAYAGAETDLSAAVPRIPWDMSLAVRKMTATPTPLTSIGQRQPVPSLAPAPRVPEAGNA